MPASPKQVFAPLRLSRQNSKKDCSTSSSDDSIHLNSRAGSPGLDPATRLSKKEIIIYNDHNALMDLYAGGPAPPIRYAVPGTVPMEFRTRRRQRFSHEAMMRRLYPSIEPESQANVNTNVRPRGATVSGVQPAKPIESKRRNSLQSNDILPFQSSRLSNFIPIPLLPALPIKAAAHHDVDCSEGLQKEILEN
ncbi:hypothetical protein CPB86DRAFT_782473 [Serendipita vermifera]|nr:hypothetical protein CPB86DRAFT_782473 [Serendipita vermifera]